MRESYRKITNKLSMLTSANFEVYKCDDGNFGSDSSMREQMVFSVRSKRRHRYSSSGIYRTLRKF